MRRPFEQSTYSVESCESQKDASCSSLLNFGFALSFRMACSPLLRTHVSGGNDANPPSANRKYQEEPPTSVGLLKNKVVRFRNGMGHVFRDDQWEVKKYLFTFRWSDVMLFPVLREIGFVTHETF